MYLFLVAAIHFSLSQAALILPFLTPQASNQSIQLSSLVSPDYPECYPTALIKSRKADSRECLRAVMMLPTTDESGFFNSDHLGKIDQFLLPVTKISGSCNVTISIPHGLMDESSWSTISSVADQLNTVCSSGYYPNSQSGGVTVTGRNGHIRVTLGRVGAL